MKKWLSVLLAMMLVFSTVAYAEEFTLRNGIKFGDTMDEVLSKETIAIESVDDGSDEEATEEESSDDEEDEEVKYPYSIRTEKTTVASIENSSILYQFDAEKTLREVTYTFRGSSNEDTNKNDYDVVNAALTRKYGTPLNYSEGNCFIFTGHALNEAVSITTLSKIIGGIGEIQEYDEWVVDADGYHVKIEEVRYYFGFSTDEVVYGHKVSYTYFTDEDLAEAQQEKRDRETAIDDDL